MVGVSAKVSVCMMTAYSLSPSGLCVFPLPNSQVTLPFILGISMMICCSVLLYEQLPLAIPGSRFTVLCSVCMF